MREARRGGFLRVEFTLPLGGVMLQTGAVCCKALPIQSCLVRHRGRSRTHLDAIDRTRRQAQLATSAALGEDGVQVFSGADDGVDRAGRQTASAADASGFVDPGNAGRGFHAMERVQRLHGPAQKLRQSLYGLGAAGRALVDRRLTAGDGRGVRFASWVTAAGALSLRQQRVDAHHDARGGHLIRMPGVAPESGDNTKISFPPGPAANIMPSDVPKRILRGAKFATTTIRRPTKLG